MVRGRHSDKFALPGWSFSRYHLTGVSLGGCLNANVTGFPEHYLADQGNGNFKCLNKTSVPEWLYSFVLGCGALRKPVPVRNGGERKDRGNTFYRGVMSKERVGL